jgi:hypothetical protein
MSANESGIRVLTIVNALPHGRESQKIELRPGASLIINGATSRNDLGMDTGPSTVAVPFDTVASITLVETDEDGRPV